MSLEPWKGQRVGNLRERITLRAEEVVGHNEFNEPIIEWVDKGTVYARAEPIKGDELMAAGQVQAYHEITFTIRHRSDLDATWQIQWRGRDYNITGWRNLDERHRYLSIEAKAIT